MEQTYPGGYPAAQIRRSAHPAQQEGLRADAAAQPYFNLPRWPEEGGPALSRAETGQLLMPRTITLEMAPGVEQEAVDAPLDRQEAFAGSLKALLGKNIGHYVVASFLMGTQSPVSWEGFLYAVGNDYLVIFQPDMDRFVTCDLYSLKFIEVHDRRGMVPPCAGARRRDGAALW